MKSKIIIIILSSIIVIQLIAGVFIVKKSFFHKRFLSTDTFMDFKGWFGGKHHFKGNRFGRHFSEPEFMKDKLSLSQEQIDRINELNINFDNEFAKYFQLIEPEKKKLKDMLSNNASDINAIKDQLQKIEAINIDIQLLHIKQGRDITNILSADQMKKLHKERRHFFDKMRKDTAK